MPRSTSRPTPSMARVARSLLARLCVLAASAVAAGAMAAPFPSKTIIVVVPYAPGASPDTLARLIAPKLSETLGQAVVVENRPGASGNIAGAYVARAEADGHTILLATQPMVTINPWLFKDMGYDPIRDLTPITACANVVMALSVHPDVPARDLAELIVYLRRNPGTAFGTSGIGTPMHLAGLRMERLEKLEVTHVSYRGGGPVLTDLIGGQIKFGFVDLASSKPFADSGKIRILAIGEPRRFDGAADIPTMSESIPGFELTSWFAFFGPARMTPVDVERWNDALRNALQDPALRDKLHAIGIVTRSDGAAALDRLMRTESASFGREVKAGAISIQ